MTLKQTRKFIYDQMLSLQKGEISIDEALTQSKLATRIIETYNTEIRAVELAATIDTTPTNYGETLKQIEK